MKKLLFVYNPYSGDGKIVKKIDKILAIFSEAGYETEPYPTQASGDGKDKIIRDGEKFDRIVAFDAYV